LANNYIIEKNKYLTKDDIPFLKKIITTKPWWDAIDVLSKVIGNLALRDNSINEILINWSKSNNMWLRRLSIEHQLLRKDKTDKELMEIIITNNFGSDEFFINKAIGWAFRDYSKTNKEWVKNFIYRYKDKMSFLSILNIFSLLFSFIL